MGIAEHIRVSLELPDMIVRRYLEDLSDDDLFVRPYPQMNHIAWQLGHLIAGEHRHVRHVAAHTMPSLPEGFADRHTTETAASDDRSLFLTKADYLDVMTAQRAGTLAVLAGFSDEELMQPSPGAIRYFGPTVGAVFAGESAHWMMHAGQWAVVRRILGHPPLF